MAELDYATVDRYWNAAQPSILAPYMMDGFGFPAGAGRFRFRAESKIVERLIAGTDNNGTVLDLGSGMGYWAEFFSHRFASAVAIEASLPLFEDLTRRCAPYANVRTIHRRVRSAKRTAPARPRRWKTWPTRRWRPCQTISAR